MVWRSAPVYQEECKTSLQRDKQQHIAEREIKMEIHESHIGCNEPAVFLDSAIASCGESSVQSGDRQFTIKYEIAWPLIGSVQDTYFWD